MAQNTTGVHLVWGVATISNGVITPPAATATTWTHIPGIVSFPSMNASPESLDATTTDELVYKTYISGLMDLGGSLEFSANLTPELETAVGGAITAQEASSSARTVVFGIEYPAPLSERYWWVGKVQPITPGEVGVNQVLQTTLYISQETGPIKQSAIGR